MNTKSNRYILSIDPSISDLGFAITTYEGAVVQFGIIKQHKRQHNYPSRALSMSQKLRDVVSSFHHPIAHAVIEMPERWISGRGAKATDSEAVQKLYYTVGSIVFVLYICGCQLWYVTPKWIGQVPKHITVRRAKQWLVKQNITVDKITDHETDAILLGKFTHEHMQYNNNSSVRFQAPIKEIIQSDFVTKVEQKMEGV